MITIVDLKGELAKLGMLRGRRPDMLEEERQASGAFKTLAPYRNGNLFSARFSGNGAWERHPNGDELVQVLEGETKFHIIADDGPQTHSLKAGMLVVVPQGAWHRFESSDGWWWAVSRSTSSGSGGLRARAPGSLGGGPTNATPRAPPRSSCSLRRSP